MKRSGRPARLIHPTGVGRCAAVGGLLMATSTLASVDPFQPPPTAQVIEQIDGDDWVLQREALALLAERKSDAAERKLIEIVESARRPAWLRGQALVTLASINAPTALDRALLLAESPWVEVRAGALEALGRIGGEKAARVTRKHLRDKSPVTRFAALEAYARLKPGEAWPTVREALEDADRQTLLKVVPALVHIDRPEARQAMLELVDHDDSRIRFQIVRALKGTGDPAMTPILLRILGGDREAHVRDASREALLALPGRTVVDRVVRAMEADGRHAVLSAIRLMSQLRDNRLFDAVAERLSQVEGDHHDAIELALREMTEFDAARYRETFVRYLDFSRDSIRRQAVRGVGSGPTEGHFKLLREPLTDDDYHVRVEALRVLRETEDYPEIGPVRYFEQLVRYETDNRHTRNHVREWSVDLLSRLLRPEQVPEAVRAFQPVLTGDDRRIRDQLIKLLRNKAAEEHVGLIAQARGYVTEWRIIGPFPSDSDNTGLDRAYPPERSIDLGATYTGADDRRVAWERWQVNEADGVVPLHALMPVPVHRRVAYGLAVLDVPTAQPVKLHLETDDGFVAWLNGEPIAKQPKSGGKTVSVELDAGEHRLLLKVANEEDWWRFSVRVTDEQGAPVAWMQPE